MFLIQIILKINFSSYLNIVHIKFAETTEVAKLIAINRDKSIVGDVESSQINQLGKQSCIEAFETIVRQVQNNELTKSW